MIKNLLKYLGFDLSWKHNNINQQQIINETLHITQEEAAEVSQAISKIFRFGLHNKWNNTTNQSHLEEELGDLLQMINILHDLNVINIHNVHQHSKNKLHKLKKWSNLNL